MPIALIFMFAALAIITPTLMSGVQQDNQLIIGTVTAKQLHQITDAAKGYITSYASDIERQPMPVTISVAQLESTGFLPQGFNEVNPYGQTWEVQVTQPDPTNPEDLEALVLSTGGTVPIPAAEAPRIASESGADGGIVESNGTAQGAYGGWTVDTSGYPDAQPGHLASLIGYSNGQLQSDYLYRVAVPGQPQLNTMQTNLDMGANNINNAQNVNVNDDVTLGNPGAATGGSAASLPGQLGVNEPAGQGFPSGWGGGIHTMDEYANGTISTGQNGYQATSMNGVGNVGVVIASNKSTGEYAEFDTEGTPGSNPGVYTNGSIGSSDGYFIQNGSWAAYNNGSTDQSGSASIGGNAAIYGNAAVQGQVSAGNIYISGSTGTNNPSGGSSGYLGFLDDSNVYVGGTCGNAIGEPATALSADSQGQILTCEDGTWQVMGVNTVVVSSGGWQYSASVQCPQNYTLTGGSCDMYRGGDGREIQPRYCAPSGNGYYCNEGNTGYCIAYAVCAVPQ